jgi:hypothetical protein
MKRLELYAEHLRAEQRCGRARNYDVLNRLTDLVQQTAGGTLLASYHYTYTADNQKASVDETLRQPDNSLQSGHTDWTYDALRRLVDEVYTNYTDSTLVYSTAYVYDLVGNRLQKLTTNNSGTDQANDQFNAADELFKEIGTHNGNPPDVGSISVGLATCP